jgi:hypothetical protein
MKSGKSSHPLNGVHTPPAAVDASMKKTGGSVNDNPVRSSAADTDRTLGPRTA